MTTENGNSTFVTYNWENGAQHDGRDPNYPCYLTTVAARVYDGIVTKAPGSVIMLAGGTHFIYAYEGKCKIRLPGLRESEPERIYVLQPGMYACVPGAVEVETIGLAAVMSRVNYHGYFLLGGPVEWKGRMRYIDGCTDSLLIPPVMMGDPCLNLLWFPSGIDQTLHTHPSARIGVVLSGRGKCRLPEGEIELHPGVLFNIRPDGVHAFSTPYGEEMRVLAFHPDSDFGPTHEEHPMLNRTIIDGVSAAAPEREQYRTK